MRRLNYYSVIMQIIIICVRFVIVTIVFQNVPRGGAISLQAKTFALFLASWPACMADEHSAIRTLINAFLLLAAPIPTIYFARELQSCDENTYWCQIFASNPLLASNVAFFLNVDIGFWFVACLQASTWLIDPYWCVYEKYI